MDKLLDAIDAINEGYAGYPQGVLGAPTVTIDIDLITELKNACHKAKNELLFYPTLKGHVDDFICMADQSMENREPLYDQEGNEIVDVVIVDGEVFYWFIQAYYEVNEIFVDGGKGNMLCGFNYVETND